MHAPLQPPDHLEGRFAPAEILPGGWYYQTNDSGVLRADLTRRVSGDVMTPNDSRRSSMQSVNPASRSSSRSFPVPRRVESIVGADAIVAYHNQQAAQRPAGGAYYEASRQAHVHIPTGTRNRRASDQEQALPNPQTPGSSPGASPRSSTSTTSLHFPLPAPPLSTTRRQNPSPSPIKTYTPTHTTETSQAIQTPLPLPVYRPGTSAARTGRSPLARKSFTRLAVKSPTGEAEAEVEREVEVRVPRRGLEEEERRGRRRRRSVSVGADGRGRRRLSKRRRGSEG